MKRQCKASYIGLEAKKGLIAALMTLITGGTSVNSTAAPATEIGTAIGTAKTYVKNAKAEAEATQVWADYNKAHAASGINGVQTQQIWRALNQLSLEGNPHAQVFAGCLIATGKAKKANLEAIELFQKAAEKLPLAQYNYGLLLTKNNLQAGTEQIKSAYEKSGLEQAGVRLMLDQLGKNNLKTAAKYANELLLINNPIAMYVRAKVDYAERNYASSLEYAQKATEAYEPNAPLLLSTLYESGVLGQSDPTLALSWKYVYRAMVSPNRAQYPNSGNDPAIATANRWLSTHAPSQKIEYQFPLCQMGRVTLKKTPL